jgi:ribosome-associated toxin RatA of RatAB toxin-antitoxin module
MPEVTKTVIVPYTPAQMFALVDDVERYPAFLPWCTAGEVSLRDETVTRATLRIGYRGVRQAFSTENHKRAPFAMDIKLVDGPFRSLDGQWRFGDLAGKGCKVEFLLAYEFSSRMLSTLIGPVFSHIADTMVEAFVKRADKVYGLYGSDTAHR